jgi:CRISPR-associated endoribonuclease Cas2
MPLNPYKLMWALVFFDLPTLTAENRRDYRLFVRYLEKHGFNRMQYSVYVRFCGSMEKVESTIRRVQRKLPAEGQVSIAMFTDKQFSRIKNFYCRVERAKNPQPQQLLLFE